MDLPPALTAAARDARRVVVLTGAGISAPSGLSTYRQDGSEWTRADMERKSHASRYGNHLPELWRDLWGPLRAATAAADPNPAHHAITRWQASLRAHDGSLLVVTQNIDGLHQRAGTTDVVEIHGTIARIRCLRCKAVHPTGPGTPPQCPGCGSGKTRPDVVLFGERLHVPTVKAVEAALAGTDLLLAVGTSGVVYPVAAWPDRVNARSVPTVLLDAAHRPGFTHPVVGDAAATLPALVEAALS